jgi:(p)ppGpp synthase/HD superfamily hydrolase
VAKLLIRLGCPEPVVVAGILHDTLEDTPVTYDTIREAFGQEVADLVASVSEPARDGVSWETRKEHTLKRLETAPWEELVLALADKLDNIRSIREDQDTVGDQVWVRFRRPKETQRWYYTRLAKIFSEKLTGEKILPLVGAYLAEVHRVFDKT